MSLRSYNKVPVWVVENHHEVLEPIYRAIATRHLPFEGIAMLHFDSHPDLQIDTQMLADTVFDKQELLSTLSIENWIMPAVYAGHLHHVTWVKPPWADQLPEGSRKVKVGKHKTSEKMRINWPDSYFVSDVLYAPNDELDNGKEATIDVVTMETPCLKASDFSNAIPVPEKCLKSKTAVENDWRNHKQLEVLNADIPTTQCADKGISCQKMSSTTSNTGSFEVYANNLCSKPHDADTDSSMEDSIQHNCAGNNRTGNQATVLSVEGLSNKDRKLCCSPDQGKIVSVRNDESRKTDSEPTTESSELKVADCGDANLRSCQASLVTGDDVVNQYSEYKGRYILDIDLDFFSTRNPFKEMYSQEQYELFAELYQFAGPQDMSEAALESCQTKRAQQISELSDSVNAAFDGREYAPSFGSKERFEKVELLVKSLKVSPDLDQECVDPELVHMAGLTCDDSGELPHHVSSDHEIDSLLVAMETWLGKMPPPTIVTIARSSRDDYCPVDQVDGIQQKVLKMLQSLYDKLDIHLEYLNE